MGNFVAWLEIHLFSRVSDRAADVLAYLADEIVETLGVESCKLSELDYVNPPFP
jgi:hypothetical protein